MVLTHDAEGACLPGVDPLTPRSFTKDKKYNRGPSIFFGQFTLKIKLFCWHRNVQIVWWIDWMTEIVDYLENERCNLKM